MEGNNSPQSPVYPQAQMTNYQQSSPAGQTQTVYVNVEKKSNGLGITGFVLAILTFVFCWAPVFNMILWFLGALFSFIGVFKKPRGLAIAGLVISFFSIIVLLVFFGTLLAVAS